MKIPRQKIELASSTEETRYTLRGVFADVKNNRVCATDGHMMAIAAAEFAPDDQAGVISLRAMREARAAAKRVPRGMRKPTAKNFFEQTIRLLKRVCTLKSHDGEVQVLQRPTGTFPEYIKVIPAVKGRPDAILNSKLLQQLMAAVTTDEVPGRTDSIAIWIDHAPGCPTEKCVLIAPLVGNALGVLMPMRDQEQITGEQVLARITPKHLLGAAHSEAK
jgi:hypothetical protein